jgi:hypothetical protein
VVFVPGLDCVGRVKSVGDSEAGAVTELAICCDEAALGLATRRGAILPTLPLELATNSVELDGTDAMYYYSSNTRDC